MYCVVYYVYVVSYMVYDTVSVPIEWEIVTGKRYDIKYVRLHPNVFPISN